MVSPGLRLPALLLSALGAASSSTVARPALEAALALTIDDVCLRKGGERCALDALQREALARGRSAIRAARESQSLCLEGRLVPELYVLGVPKCGTTSLYENLEEAGVIPAQFTFPAPQQAKEFHFFDCSVGVGCSRDRGLWLQQQPSCPSTRALLADLTPDNIRQVPLPGGAAPSWRSQEMPPVPETLVSFYGEELAHRLTFVVLLGEPLRRYQSAYYHAKAKDWEGSWITIKADSFQESLRDSLQAAQASPPTYSDQGLWPDMYSWHFQEYLRKFAASQFLVVPKMAYFNGGGEMLCKDLSRMLGQDLCQSGDWSSIPHALPHDHPSIEEEDILPQLLAEWQAFMAPEHERLLDILAGAQQDGMHLFNYTGAEGSQEDIDSWLRASWD